MNQKVAYGLLFKAAGDALLKCARNIHYLGAQAGIVALLHTWGQTLTYHPHIHTIVPAGGLSEDGMEWIPSAKTFFVPVKLQWVVHAGKPFATPENLIRYLGNYTHRVAISNHRIVNYSEGKVTT